MPKQVSETELNQIVTVIMAHSGGIGGNAIRKSLKLNIQPHTLQYRLKRLIAEKRIRSEGRGTGKCYFSLKDQALADTERNMSRI